MDYMALQLRRTTRTKEVTGSLASHMKKAYTAQLQVVAKDKDLPRFESPETMAHIPGEDMDELLYVLKHAPLLSEKYMPEDLRQEWFSGKFNHTMMDSFSGKMENTKWDETVRDVHATCDTFREMLAE
eukprot:208189-Amphidinium_carterae.1